ncbi:MAG: beta-ketoacyl-ACP synthase III [Anaerolineae bacterium]|nr:ketoacyl-ACP synthase III [Thermoflexales bacterium]MDW8408782.1 beta-ketoacyl-ACP synthase III [Anaerolineae bacterium]
MRYAHITGWGKYLPERVVTNDDLARLVDTSDNWIRERTGIATRRIAGRRDTNASLAVAAAVDALDVAGLSGAQLDLIIVATSTPDHVFPATACAVQDALGATRAGAFDLSAACSGFIYALGMAADSIRAGTSQHVLVIGSEVMSRIVDWTDRNTCVLFGDGAGAVVLSASTQPGGVLSTVLRADGSGGDLLMVCERAAVKQTNGVSGASEMNGRAPVGREDTSSAPTTADVPRGGRQEITQVETPTLLDLPTTHQTILMNGREVFRFATRAIDRATREVMHRAGWLPEHIDLIVPHQANIRIIESASKSLGIPVERFYSNIDRYGNTSAASIPIALCEAIEEGRLRQNDRLVLVGFGSGLTWAASAVQWGPPPSMNPRQRLVNRVRYGLAGVRSRARRVLRHLETKMFGTPDNGAPTIRLVSSAPPNKEAESSPSARPR